MTILSMIHKAKDALPAQINHPYSILKLTNAPNAAPIMSSHLPSINVSSSNHTNFQFRIRQREPMKHSHIDAYRYFDNLNR